jgi:DNA-binding Lrp family transcriptional regulator
MAMDEINKKIVNLLIKNSRYSAREISRLLDISPVTVINRMARLEEEGVLKKYSVITDYEKSGIDFQIIINISPQKEKTKELEKMFLNNSFISNLYYVSGDYQMMIIARFSEKKDLNIFLKQISENPLIKNFSSQFIMKTSKEETVEL